VEGEVKARGVAAIRHDVQMRTGEAAPDLPRLRHRGDVVDLAGQDQGRNFAFEVDRREEVDEAHARCLASGAKVHFPPEEDRDEPGYYAFFALDPDGIRVEVFCWPR
jgi:catechol 2,3-dioxygenase-like lactoylglutathione lyase family enzyme